MRLFLILLSREIKAFFYSPVAYVVMFCFLLLTGFNFYFTIYIFISQGAANVTVLEQFFNSIVFWMCTLLCFPLITMRLFSEEYKLGTIESLMTAPVQDWQVVLSKYFGALFFYIILWVPSAFYFPIFEWITKTNASYSIGAYLGSYTFMLLVGMFYISIGCLASALTRNQIAAAIMSLAAVILLFLSGLFSLMETNVTPLFRDLVAYFSTIQHMQDFSSGMFDSRPVVYYLTMTTFVLFITYQVFQTRKWKL